MKNQLIRFFAPTKARILIFFLFLILVALANIQTEGFVNNQNTSQIYKIIKEIPFLTTTIYLLVPIMIITVPLAEGALTLPIAMIYLYMLSCVIAWCIKRKEQKIPLLVAGALSIVLGIFIAFDIEITDISLLLSFVVAPILVAGLLYLYILIHIILWVLEKKHIKS